MKYSSKLAITLLVCALITGGILFASGCGNKKKDHHDEREAAAAMALLYSGNGSWTEIDSGINCPQGRSHHTAIWTGSEMIIWGGVQYDQYGYCRIIDNGAVYNAGVDQWEQVVYMPGFALGAYEHTSVWTGSEMIIWGGQFFNASAMNVSEIITITDSGGIYNPDNNTWRQTSTAGLCPSSRESHSAVYTGNSMILWGGSDFYDLFNSGGIYFPENDSWIPTSTSGACPTARKYHSAVWTGSKMIIWGGSINISGGLLAELNGKGTGAVYDPQTDMWIPTSTDGDCPSARTRHRVEWTGTHMIVWGGAADYAGTNEGAMYNPVTDEWTAISTNFPSPTAAVWITSVWTGTYMIVWGDYSSNNFPYNGGIFDPAADRWTAVYSGPGSPGYGIYRSAVWTGSEMIIWGGRGRTLSGSESNKGYKFTP
ncbi:MAG: hypothetical protein E3J72_05120 [Planctomycetota bacterium]|nr:MAG: hypothetical protein E3J72_05120 [Planctomycetota bacterium]